MYKGKKSWYLLIFSIFFFCLYIYLYFNIQSNLETSTPIKSIILPLYFLSSLFHYIKTSAIKISINDDSIHFKTLFRKGKVQFNSIISVNFPNDRKIEIFKKNKKIIIPLELQNSSLFLKEFRTKYDPTKSYKSLNQDQYYRILKKRAFKDHRNNRINLHLWKPIILTLILFYIGNLLTDSLTPFNIFRIIFLLILPITTFFLPEVNFAYNIEKKANDEDDILTRNYGFERKIYIKYFSYGLLTLIVLICSFWVI